MIRFKTILYTIVVIVLLFGFVPIRVPPPKKTLSNNTEILFSEFIGRYNKTYQNNDSLKFKKFAAFQDNLEEMQSLNVIRLRNSSARFGVTKYSDMTKEEFLNKYLQNDLFMRVQNRSRYIKKRKPVKNVHVLKAAATDIKLPLKVDWRTQNVLTKIKNQKDCGACWAFSTVETMETMKALKGNKLEEFSVQEVIDCAGYTSNGCAGGDICGLLYWLQDNSFPIQKNQEYPLKWKTGSCKIKKNVTGVKIADFTCFDYVGIEEVMLYLLAKHGPLTVAVNALLWQNYLGGVIHYHCDSEDMLMNHAVQIVGYDRTAEIPHYIVRNSWGADFGDEGYLYIAIGSNMCGIANEVASLDVI